MRAGNCKFDQNKMDGQEATDRQLTDLLEEARKLKEDLRLDKAKLVDGRCGSANTLNSNTLTASSIIHPQCQ